MELGGAGAGGAGGGAGGAGAGPVLHGLAEALRGADLRTEAPTEALVSEFLDQAYETAILNDHADTIARLAGLQTLKHPPTTDKFV